MACYRKIILILSLLLGLFSIGYAAENLYLFTDPQHEKRYQQLLLEIRCAVCENQSLIESNSPLAEDLRDEIYQRILAGETNEKIKAFLVERYGINILYEPPVQANTLFLWLAPLFLVLIGLTIWLWKRV